MAKTPAYILSGFLGSGKTTLLLRLLDAARRQNLKYGILINEIGQMDVDGQIVAGQEPDAIIDKLMDGCICCSKKSEVASCIVRLLQRQPDVLFIELSGIANPEEIADALTEPELLQRIALEQTISVVDAENFLEYNSIFSADRELIATLRKQVAAADLIVVNKASQINNGHRAKIDKALRKLNEHAEIVSTDYCKFEVEPLLASVVPHPQMAPAAALTAPNRFRMAGKANNDLRHGGISTVLLPVPQPLPPKQVERFLKQLAPQLLRAKGYCQVEGLEGPHLMQHAGKRTYWQPADFPGEPYVVLIGFQLEPGKMLLKWNEALYGA